MLSRRGLLWLSRQRWLRRWMERSATGGRLQRRFVAGVTLEEAIAVCRRLHSEGIGATLDHLGENVRTQQEADQSLDAGLAAISSLSAAKLPATISIKLTQYGLDLDEDSCRGRLATVAKAAAAADRRVEIDMESSEYTERTLALVEAVHGETGNLRAVIQAYLRRSAGDVTRLNRLGIPVRLCKGAYLEGPGVAFPTKAEVDDNYRTLMRGLIENGADPAIATHDDVMIGEAIDIARQFGLTASDFEFQMLYGVRRPLQRSLVEQGYRVRVYVPYGEAWYPYFMRRLAERPANVWFALRSIVGN